MYAKLLSSTTYSKRDHCVLGSHLTTSEPPTNDWCARPMFYGSSLALVVISSALISDFKIRSDKHSTPFFDSMGMQKGRTKRQALHYSCSDYLNSMVVQSSSTTSTLRAGRTLCLRGYASSAHRGGGISLSGQFTPLRPRQGILIPNLSHSSQIRP